jgi:hypothetical protein
MGRAAPAFMHAELRAVCAEVAAATGIKFLDQVVIKDKNLPIEGIEAFEVRFYFKGCWNRARQNMQRASL